MSDTVDDELLAEQERFLEELKSGKTRPAATLVKGPIQVRPSATTTTTTTSSSSSTSPSTSTQGSPSTKPLSNVTPKVASGDSLPKTEVTTAPPPASEKKRSLFAQRRAAEAKQTASKSKQDAEVPEYIPISRVLGDVVERDHVEIAPIEPKFNATGLAFPPVQHRSEKPFGANKRAKSAAAATTPTEPTIPVSQVGASTSRESTTSSATLFKEVDEENTRKLANMDPQKIEEMRQEIFSSMDSRLIEILRKRAEKRNLAKKVPLNNRAEILDQEKRKWMEPIDEETIKQDRTQAKSDLEVAYYRFDLDGELLLYYTPKGVVEVKNALEDPSIDPTILYHHGDNPSLPGYTINELMQLSRSAVPSQRASALRAIERIIYKSRHYHYVLPTHPPGLPVLVNELVISYLLDQAYVATALRYAVDDKNPSIMLLALKALHSLLYSEFDEQVFDNTELMWRGLESYPLSPTAHDDNRRTPSEEDTSDEDDHEFMQRDLILGLLNTELLVRLRFILELLNPEPIVVIVILRILLRIARHSAESAGHFVRCPGLLEVLHGLIGPSKELSVIIPLTLRVLRVAAANHKAVALTLCDMGIGTDLARFILKAPKLIGSNDNQPTDVLRFELVCIIEALKFMNVLARHDVDCAGILIDNYPVFSNLLSQPIPPSAPQCAFVIKALVVQLLESLALVALRADDNAMEINPPTTTESEKEASAAQQPTSRRLRWNEVSPLLHTCLTALKTSCSTDNQSPHHTLFIGSLAHFLATYFAVLPRHVQGRMDEERQHIEQVVANYVIPLLSSNAFNNAIDYLSERDHLVFTQNDLLCVERADEYCPAAQLLGELHDRYALTPAISLTNLPTLGWTHKENIKARHVKPKFTKVGVSANLVLSGLRLVEVLASSYAPLAPFTTTIFAVIARRQQLRAGPEDYIPPSPLLLAYLRDRSPNLISAVHTIAKRFVSREALAGFPSSSRSAIFACRVVQSLMLQIVRILPPDDVRMDASIALVGRTLPGEEEDVKGLVEFMIYPFVMVLARPDATIDIIHEEKKTRRTPTIIDFFEDALNIEYTEETVGVSLLLPAEISELPFLARWPYAPIRYFQRFLRVTKSSEISQTNSIAFIQDCLRFIRCLESAKPNYSATIAPVEKLQHLMTVCTFGRSIFSDDVIAAELETIVQLVLDSGALQRIAAFDMTGANFDVSLVDKLIKVWISESFGQRAIGLLVVAWMVCGIRAPWAKELSAAPPVFTFDKDIDKGLWQNTDAEVTLNTATQEQNTSAKGEQQPKKRKSQYQTLREKQREEELRSVRSFVFGQLGSMWFLLPAPASLAVVSELMSNAYTDTFFAESFANALASARATMVRSRALIVVNSTTESKTKSKKRSDNETQSSFFYWLFVHHVVRYLFGVSASADTSAKESAGNNDVIAQVDANSLVPPFLKHRTIQWLVSHRCPSTVLHDLTRYRHEEVSIAAEIASNDSTQQQTLCESFTRAVERAQSPNSSNESTTSTRFQYLKVVAEREGCRWIYNE